MTFVFLEEMTSFMTRPPNNVILDNSPQNYLKFE